MGAAGPALSLLVVVAFRLLPCLAQGLYVIVWPDTELAGIASFLRPALTEATREETGSGCCLNGCYPTPVKRAQRGASVHSDILISHAIDLANPAALRLQQGRSGLASILT
ncbi:hypothetical protein B0H63DRAFT_454416 [Podospora didyma]|uniref:Uncharacterized protein n=1 Tax=Podospora didyma TaxID=330526 RepID=A0AAE0N4R4_9PEZI|nr:hypothetical protein B0H63DRAFT_454416 [Podospora didyma]